MKLVDNTSEFKRYNEDMTYKSVQKFLEENKFNLINTKKVDLPFIDLDEPDNLKDLKDLLVKLNTQNIFIEINQIKDETIEQITYTMLLSTLLNSIGNYSNAAVVKSTLNIGELLNKFNIKINLSINNKINSYSLFVKSDGMLCRIYYNTQYYFLDEILKIKEKLAEILDSLSDKDIEIIQEQLNEVIDDGTE